MTAFLSVNEIMAAGPYYVDLTLTLKSLKCVMVSFPNVPGVTDAGSL